MSLPIQSFRLSEVAEAGMDWAGVAGVERGGAPAVQAIGECFAFYSEPLNEEAQRERLSWHLWLLRRAVVGLWEERSRNKAYGCYTLHPGTAGRRAKWICGWSSSLARK